MENRNIQKNNALYSCDIIMKARCKLMLSVLLDLCFNKKGVCVFQCNCQVYALLFQRKY